MIKVAAFTGGKNVPSARFRVRQFITKLEKEGIQLHEYPAHFGAYPPAIKLIRPFWALGTLGQRFPAVVKSHFYDAVFLQREMLSTMMTLEPLTKLPRILDVDDAIWLNGRKDFAGHLARKCATVICGNQFLADYFSKWNKNISIIPTAVDADRFYPLPTRVEREELIIGWTGSYPNLKYVYGIESALHKVLQANPRARLRIISDQAPKFRLLPPEKVEFIPWSPAIEVSALQDLTVGIMPLEDSDWERGKCSYKLLLYLACGIPVVASPVGMNIQILSLAELGTAAKSTDEWTMALNHLLTAPRTRTTMGNAGRKVVLNHYSMDVILASLTRQIRQVAA